MKNDMSHNFKVVMFDIDACLIDSAPNLILTLDRAVFDTGGGHHDERYLRQMLGLPGSALNDLFDLPDWEHTLRTWSEYYAPLAVENKPFAGIEPLLAAIKRAGLPLGVPRRAEICIRSTSINTDLRTISTSRSARTM